MMRPGDHRELLIRASQTIRALVYSSVRVESLLGVADELERAADAWSACESCGDPILWVELLSGSRIPIDPEFHTTNVTERGGHKRQVLKGHICYRGGSCGEQTTE